MKSFCILEQGCSINDPLTLKKKNLFTTEFSDFYRLNWKNDNDPNAFITKKGITWSEGRSLLYEKVPKNYEYYIFTDDDIEFQATNYVEDIPNKIKELLNEYKPIAGTFFDPTRWQKNQFSFPRSIGKEVYLSRKAFPIAGYDLQSQICSRSFADTIFPVVYHGSSGTLWYSHWACYRLFPLKQICFTEIQVINARRGGHFSQENDQYSSLDKVVWLFNKDVKNKALQMKIGTNLGSDFQNKNRDIFNHVPDKTEVEFSLGDLEKIYDINNSSFCYRVSIADDMYKKRLEVSQKELDLLRNYTFYKKTIKPRRRALKYWWLLKKIIKNTIIQRKLNH